MTLLERKSNNRGAGTRWQHSHAGYICFDLLGVPFRSDCPSRKAIMWTKWPWCSKQWCLFHRRASPRNCLSGFINIILLMYSVLSGCSWQVMHYWGPLKASVVLQGTCPTIPGSLHCPCSHSPIYKNSGVSHMVIYYRIKLKVRRQKQSYTKFTPLSNATKMIQKT